MLESGLLLFFLVPGLLAYCALYGTFHSGKSIAPEPPQASSIEAVTLVLLASAIIHMVATFLLQINEMICASGNCPLNAPPGLLDPYSRAFAAINDGKVNGDAVGGLIAIALGQGAIAYGAVRLWLRHRAKQDRLPEWIYGWATDIANAVDNDDTIIVAYVLTNHETEGKTIVYAGVLYDMALKSDGCLLRLTLWDCERYLANLSGSLDDKTLPEPSSRFPFMMIEANQIRNVAFEIVDLEAMETVLTT